MSHTKMNRIDQYDQENADALRGIWFLGDIHAEYKHLASTLLHSQRAQNWLCFWGILTTIFGHSVSRWNRFAGIFPT